jgi:hypothetical protein
VFEVFWEKSKCTTCVRELVLPVRDCVLLLYIIAECKLFVWDLREKAVRN